MFQKSETNNVTVDDVNKAYEHLAKLALQAMIENKVDLTIDEYTRPKTREFLIVVHRSGIYQASILKR